MSYPSIGMPGLLPDGQEWNASTIEDLLRKGGHIYLEEGMGLAVARYDAKAGEFQVYEPSLVVDEACEDTVLYSASSFLEFAVWLAFFGRDFL